MELDYFIFFSTHGFVYDQRYVEVDYKKIDMGIDITIPNNFGKYNYQNVLPPGPYFIFITFENGWVSIMQPWEMKVDNEIIPVFTIFIE